MNIYTNNIPYTYLIGWTERNLWYYGVRYANHCNPKDLWVFYFTSSTYVKRIRNLYGEPDVIQVRKVFKDDISARTWEYKVLKRLNVEKKNKWLNKRVDCKSIQRDIEELKEFIQN